MYINPSKPSGHYMYRQLNSQQFYVLPTQCICVFCVDLRTNSDYFLYSVNWLVFITETESVYCAVCTGVPLNRGGPGSIPGQSMWDFWWTKWHWARFFSQYSSVPCHYHPTNSRYSPSTTKSSNGRSVGTFTKAVYFPNFGPLDSVFSVQTLNAVRDWCL